jgi:predicted Zn finger-like uncharacterized protein
MMIFCPSCSAKYEVPAALLTQPRAVRCGKCEFDWVADPVSDAISQQEHDEADIDELAHEPVSAHSATSGEPDPFDYAPEMEKISEIERFSSPAGMSFRLRRSDRALTIAWAASFAALAGLGVAGYTERSTFMREWPASKRVYAAIGLAPVDAIIRGHGTLNEGDDRPAK